MLSIEIFSTPTTPRVRGFLLPHIFELLVKHFWNSLPLEVTYDADASVRVLIACLRVIAERSGSKLEDIDTSDGTEITTTRPAVAALFDGSVTIWDLLAFCYPIQAIGTASSSCKRRGSTRTYPAATFIAPANQYLLIGIG